MKFVLALAVWASLVGSAHAASVPDWPTKCAIFRSALERGAEPPSSGEFERSPNHAFDGLAEGLSDRIGSPTPNLTDYLIWPNPRCPGRDSARDERLFFGEPLVDRDYAAVDLLQQVGLTRNFTRFVLQLVDGRWKVISTLTYKNQQLQDIQIIWRPRAPRSSRRSSATEPRSFPGS